MAQVQIKIDQAAKPAGIAGQAREDLVTGVAVAVQLVGGPYLQQLWTIPDKPIDIVAATQSAAGYVDPAASSTTIQPIDLPGTYLLQVVVDSGSGLGATPADQATITFYAGPTLNVDPRLLPRRIPAFGERTQHNTVNAMFPAGNPKGWALEWLRWFAYLTQGSAAPGTIYAWARVTLTGGGAAVFTGSGINVARTGVGTVDVSFVTPLANNHFAVSPTARGATGGSAVVHTEATTGFTIERADGFGALVDADFDIVVVK